MNTYETAIFVAVKLHERLRVRRKELGLSQPDVAELTGLSVASISNYERGVRSPDVDDLLKIADALQTSLVNLLNESDDGKNSKAAIELSTHSELGLPRDLQIPNPNPPITRNDFIRLVKDLTRVAEDLNTNEGREPDINLDELRKRMTPEEFLAFVGEGFQALALDGSLSAEDVIDRIMRVRTQLKKDGKL